MNPPPPPTLKGGVAPTAVDGCCCCGVVDDDAGIIGVCRVDDGVGVDVNDTIAEVMLVGVGVALVVVKLAFVLGLLLLGVTSG